MGIMNLISKVFSQGEEAYGTLYYATTSFHTEVKDGVRIYHNVTMSAGGGFQKLYFRQMAKDAQAMADVAIYKHVRPWENNPLAILNPDGEAVRCWAKFSGHGARVKAAKELILRAYNEKGEFKYKTVAGEEHTCLPGYRKALVTFRANFELRNDTDGVPCYACDDALLVDLELLGGCRPHASVIVDPTNPQSVNWDWIKVRKAQKAVTDDMQAAIEKAKKSGFKSKGPDVTL